MLQAATLPRRPKSSAASESERHRFLLPVLVTLKGAAAALLPPHKVATAITDHMKVALTSRHPCRHIFRPRPLAALHLSPRRDALHRHHGPSRPRLRPHRSP